MSQREVAAAMDWSVSKLIRIESGQVNISTNDLRALLNHYGIDRDRINELIGIARAAREPTPWSSYRDVASAEYIAFLALESSASVIRNFEPIFVPGLLQTEDYARTLIRMVEGESSEKVDPLVELRMRRQEILERDGPPSVHFIMDEAVVRRVAGNREIMRRQLQKILQLAEEGRVTVRLVSFERGLYPHQRTSHVLLEFPDPDDEDVLFVENPQGDYLIREGSPEERGSESPIAFLGSFWELEQIASRDHALDFLRELLTH